MITKAPEAFVAKVQAAIVEHDPDEVVDELALQKAAYYIHCGMGCAAFEEHTCITKEREGWCYDVKSVFPDDGNVFEIYEIIKFVASFQAPCGHQAYKQATASALYPSRHIIACGEHTCNNYVH
jgi:hypothetical protein